MSCCTLSTKKRLAVCSAQLFALNCWGVGTWVQGWFPRLCSPHSQQLLASTSPIANSTTLLFCGCLLFACINLFRVHTKLATASQSIVSFSTVQLLACKCSLPSMILYMFWHCSCSWLGCTNSRTPDRLRHVHPFCDFEGLGKKRRKLGWDVLSCENFVYTELARWKLLWSHFGPKKMQGVPCSPLQKPRSPHPGTLQNWWTTKTR